MDDTKTQNIQSIDLSDFPLQYEKLRKASEVWGCFRILNHNIPLELMQEMKLAVKPLLDLPMDIKKRNEDVIASSGYMAPSPRKPPLGRLGDTIVKYAQAIHELQDDENVGGLEMMDKSGEFVAWRSHCHSRRYGCAGMEQWKVLQRETSCTMQKDNNQGVNRHVLVWTKRSSVEAPGQLVGSEHPRLYLPFTHEGYRKRRLTTKLRAAEALAFVRTST